MEIQTDQANRILAKLDGIAEDVSDLKISVAEDIGDLKASVAEDIGDLKISIAEDIGDLKVGLARCEEQLKALNERQTTTEKRVNSQDGRLWGFIVVLVVGLLGFLAKVTFFGKV